MTSIMDSSESHLGKDSGIAPGTERERAAGLLSELAGCETDKAAVQLALERASDAVDAELCIYVDGNLTESATSDPALVVPVFGRLRGHLVLTRAGRAFDDGERDRIQPIARTLSLFEPGAGPEPLLDRLALQEELAQAVEEGQIQAHYLPKVDLRSARVIGVEALARWLHPDRGELAAGEFVDLAEAVGLMPAFTERIVNLSTQATGDWWRSGLRLKLSVNLPASALTEPDPALDELVSAALVSTGLPSDALRFEITEDAIMAAPDAAQTLERLKSLGVTISIDDFGTGHTSLGQLKDLPVDELKIDRSFTRTLTRGEGKGIVRSTIQLARQMDLQVVAEGVETEETWRQLRGMGCDGAQGFLIGKPMAAREVPAWLASWDTRGRQLNRIRRDQLEMAGPRGRKRSHARDEAPA
jgi:EAL domain-containing protein (putative c-di-GMP-specific phosphodiesterase class I)